MRRLLALCSLAALMMLAAPSAGAQALYARFEITAVGDTSFRFYPGRMTWIEPGQLGIAVDPRQRDVMVARFRVVSVRDGIATAVITGQTTRVGTDHMALVAPPERPWYARRTFWVGAGLGAVLGGVLGSSR